jgi:NAD+ diphosphatase
MEQKNAGAEMKLAETVTFGGSRLDRDAVRRADIGLLEAEMAGPDARILPLWRGKPLFVGSDRAPGFVAKDHSLLADHFGTWVYLGRDGDERYFAVDVSGWEPDEVPDTLEAFLDPSEQRHPDLPESHAYAELRAVMWALDPRTAELAATAKAVLGWHRTHRFCARCGGDSDLDMAGWQRICPDCGGHHFPRTDPVVIMLITHGNDVLLGRSPGWPEGMYSLLAGFVEPGETIEAAVRREVFEEAGIEVGEVGYLASQPWPFPSSLMIGCRGEALTRKMTIDPVEIEDAIWMPREEMVEAINGHHPVLKPARKGAIAHFLLSHWLTDRLD